MKATGTGIVLDANDLAASGWGNKKPGETIVINGTSFTLKRGQWAGEMIATPSGPPPAAGVVLPPGSPLRNFQLELLRLQEAANAEALAEARRQQAAANAAARQQTVAQNQATRRAADQQYSLLAGFEKQRDTKLSNIDQTLQDSERLLLENYGTASDSLGGLLSDNDKAESDLTFQNISNTVRERQDLLAQAALQGAGETDVLRTQVQALRNYADNQGGINRAFFDTLRNVNNATSALNTDTYSARANLSTQAESDRESAYSNYYNQMADTYNQIFNIENSNTNRNSATSVAYQAAYGNAAAKTAEYAGMSYERQGLPSGLDQWQGRREISSRDLTSSNQAAAISLNTELKRPEGSTLRKW